MITELFKNLIESLSQNGLAYAIVCAFSAWIGKVWAARIAHKESAELQKQITTLKDGFERAQKKLAGDIEKSVHIHKVQFEKEFLIYQDLMEHARKLRSTFFDLNNHIKSSSELTKGTLQRLKTLLDTFDDAYSKLRHTVDVNKPFYAEEVFLQSDRLTKLAIADMAQHMRSPNKENNSWEELTKIRDDFYEVSDDLCTAIRHRLSTIVIVE